MSRRDSITTIAGALVSGGLLLAAAPAGAGTLYRWVTENGTLAFADDAKRIPERYRAQAEEIQTEGLDGYERFTPTDGAAQEQHAERLDERLGRLRGEEIVEIEGPAEVPALEGGEGAAVSGVALGVSETTRRTQVKRSFAAGKRRHRYQSVEQPLPVIDLPPGAEDEGPVVVEELQIRDREGFTRRARVVRQGDRILSIVKGPKHHFNPRDFVDEEDLER